MPLRASGSFRPRHLPTGKGHGNRLNALTGIGVFQTATYSGFEKRHHHIWKDDPCLCSPLPQNVRFMPLLWLFPANTPLPEGRKLPRSRGVFAEIGNVLWSSVPGSAKTPHSRASITHPIGDYIPATSVLSNTPSILTHPNLCKLLHHLCQHRRHSR